MPSDTRDAFLQRIEAEQEILYRLSLTCNELRAFERALTARVGERWFWIANETLWEAMLARRDILVIHFASWIRGLAENGGLFGQLRAHHLTDLRKAWNHKVKTPATNSGGAAERDPWIHTVLAQGRRRRLEQRFPGAIARGRIDPEDVEACKDAIWEKLKPVVHDRDSYRAHPHDGVRKADARMLRLDEIEPLLVEAQDMLNDLRLAADFSTFAYPDTAATEPRGAAKDFVDLLLVGDIQLMAMRCGVNTTLHRLVGSYWWQVREDFFETLEREHAKQPELALNADEILDAVEAAMKTKYDARTP